MTRTFVTCTSLLLLALPATAFAQLAGSRSVVAGAGATTGTAATQPGNLVVRLIKTGGQEFTDKNTWAPITEVGKNACDQGTLTVTIGSLPIVDTYPFVEAWLGTGQGMCEKGDRNSRSATSGSSTNCTRIPLPNEGRMIPRPFATLDVPLSDEICANEGEKSLYFLAMKSQNSADNAMYYGVLKFTLDKTAPSAANNVRGGPGETQIKVEWNLPETTQWVWIFADTNATRSTPQEDAGDIDAGSSGSDCHSTFFREGGEIDPKLLSGATVPDGVLRTEEDRKVSSHTYSGLDEFFGRKLAAVAVVVGDRAKNPSKISNVLCVDVVKTVGFWDRYQNNGGTAEPGCACSAPGARSAGLGALAVLPMLGIVGVLAARQRRRRGR